MPEANQGYATFTYEINSRDIQPGESSATDPKYYIAKIVAALSPHSTTLPPSTTVEAMSSIDVYAGEPPTILYNRDPETLNTMKSERITQLAQNLRSHGASWVTADKLQSLIESLLQDFMRNTIDVVATNTQTQCTEAGGIPLPKFIPLYASALQNDNFSPNKLTLHDSIITFESTADVFAYAAETVTTADDKFIHSHETDPKVHDIRITAAVKIDLYALLENDPQEPAIIQTVTVQSLTDDISIKLKANLAELKTSGTPAPEIEPAPTFIRRIFDAIATFFERIFNAIIYKLFLRNKPEVVPDEDGFDSPVKPARGRSDSSDSMDTDSSFLSSTPHTKQPPAHRKRDLLLGYRGFKRSEKATVTTPPRTPPVAPFRNN